MKRNRSMVGVDYEGGLKGENTWARWCTTPGARCYGCSPHCGKVCSGRDAPACWLPGKEPERRLRLTRKAPWPMSQGDLCPCSNTTRRIWAGMGPSHPAKPSRYPTKGPTRHYTINLAFHTTAHSRIRVRPAAFDNSTRSQLISFPSRAVPGKAAIHPGDPGPSVPTHTKKG